MADQGLSEKELQNEVGEQLPGREAMSLVNANLAIPINAALALNVLSDGAIAGANAEQLGDIAQTTGTGDATTNANPLGV
jgi:hypothetical protein